MDQSFDQLVTESLAKRLSDAELRCAQLEALYTLTAKKLQETNDVLAYDSALKELFEEVKGKMTNGN
jgi:hypothetical protein